MIWLIVFSFIFAILLIVAYCVYRIEKNHKESLERIKKARPLTGTTKEVFKGVLCAGMNARY